MYHTWITSVYMMIVLYNSFLVNVCCSVVIVKDDIINKNSFYEYRKMCWIVCLLVIFFSLNNVDLYLLFFYINNATFTALNNEWSNLKYSVRTVYERNKKARKKCSFFFMPNIFHWLFHSHFIRIQNLCDIASNRSRKLFEYYRKYFYMNEIEHLKNIVLINLFNNEMGKKNICRNVGKISQKLNTKYFEFRKSVIQTYRHLLTSNMHSYDKNERVFLRFKDKTKKQSINILPLVKKNTHNLSLSQSKDFLRKGRARKKNVIWNLKSKIAVNEM